MPKAWVDITLNSAGSSDDLDFIKELIGDARTVGLSEGVHGAVQPAAFRNRLFQFLVKEAGFGAIALESGLVESRVLHDYVTGDGGDLETALSQGWSWEFDDFEQNWALITWIREYNAGLPSGSPVIEVFGFDISGSPGNPTVARTPETALVYTLEYLLRVDPETGQTYASLFADFIPVLASTNDYGGLAQDERDTLTAAIADLINLIERRRFKYVDLDSEENYEWARQAAAVAGQVDTWFRQMPLEWQLSDGFAWTSEAGNVRDRAMYTNFEWIRGRVGADRRLLVFSSVPHMAATPIFESTNSSGRQEEASTPFAAYVAAAYENDFVNILNMIGSGEIAFCSEDSPPSIRVQPASGTIETFFASVGVPAYFVDFRNAPPAVSSWLNQEHEMRNRRFAPGAAFDAAFYLEQVSSDCR